MGEIVVSEDHLAQLWSTETQIEVAGALWDLVWGTGVSTETLELLEYSIQGLRDEGFVVDFVAYDDELGESKTTLVARRE